MANIEELKKSVEQKMDKTLETLKADLHKVRTGRASTGLLDHLHVDYYGNPTPLNQRPGLAPTPPARCCCWPSAASAPTGRAM